MRHFPAARRALDSAPFARHARQRRRQQNTATHPMQQHGGAATRAPRYVFRAQDGADMQPRNIASGLIY